MNEEDLTPFLRKGWNEEDLTPFLQTYRLLAELRRETLPVGHIDSLPDACASILRVSKKRVNSNHLLSVGRPRYAETV
jgi:hypothetical protein